MNYKPYCYLIGWTKYDLWYYGCQYSQSKTKPANPNNLWSSYFTSSKLVATARTLYGEPDVIRISKKQFTSELETRVHEEKFLTKVNARRSNRWLNLTNGDAKCPSNKGRVFSDEHKEKLRQAKLGKKLSVEHRAKIGAASKAMTRTAEHSRKISESNKGRKLTPEQCINASLRAKGKPWSQARRDTENRKQMERPQLPTM